MNKKRSILLAVLTVCFLILINFCQFLNLAPLQNHEKGGDEPEGDNDLLDYLTQPAKPRRYEDSYYLSHPAPGALATGHWVTKNAMPVNRCDTPNGAIGQEGVDTAIYEFGGENFNTSYTLNLKYNTKTDNWSVKAPMTQRREEFALGVCSGKMYAMGGHTWTVGGLQSTLNLVEEYIPLNNTWTTKNPMPNPRTWPATASFNGKIYVVGGWHRDSMVMFSNNDIYDAVTDTWTTGAAISPARCEFAAAVVNGSIYFIGGNDGASNPMNLNQKYDPVTNTWTNMAPMPSPRMRFAMAVIDNRIFCIGGAYTAADPRLACTTNEVYDPATNTWAADQPMPTKRLNAGASAVDGLIYVIGGVNEDSYIISQCLNVNEVFIPAILNLLVEANPTEVISGNQCEIKVNVTDGLYPVRGATVNLSDGGSGGSFGAVTDLGNGNYTANYTAPFVTSKKYVTVTAQVWKPGFTARQKTCYITVNPFPTLAVKVDATPTTVISCRNITVNISVVDACNPISGATIDLTDSKGGSFGLVTDMGGGNYTSVWTAPVVSTSQLVIITANASKTNYTKGQGTASVLVKPYPKLQVTAYANPPQVTTGLNTTISIHVTDSVNPVSGAAIVLSDNGSGGKLGPVVETGGGDYEAVYTTPIVTSPKYVKVTANATSPGFYNGTGSVNVGVNLVPTLQVAVESNLSSVLSGDTVKLTVNVANNFIGISLALVTLSDKGAGGSFGTLLEDGMGNYTASYRTPLVITQTFVRIVANASKSGYNNGTGSCDIDVELRTLSVSVNAAKYILVSGESVAMMAQVNDSMSGQGIRGAAMTFSDGFAGGSFTTVADNADGSYSTIYTAPVVTFTQSITVKVQASKLAYGESEDSCGFDVNPVVQKMLHGTITANATSIPPDTTAELTIHVTDGSSDVDGATVSLTADNGTCGPAGGDTAQGGVFKSVFEAPVVSSNVQCTIKAVFSKPDYTGGDASVKITVDPSLVPKADLAIVSGDINVTEIASSSSVKVEINVENRGDTAACNVTLRVMLGNMTALNDTDIGTIGAGKSVYYKFYLYGISGGKHTLTVQLDPQNSIPELYEDNNNASKDFTIGRTEDSGSDTWTYIAIGTIVPVILIFLLLFLLMVRRRKKDEEDEKQRALEARQLLMQQYTESMRIPPPQ